MINLEGLETQINNSNNKTIDRVIEIPVAEIVVNEDNFYETKDIDDLLESFKMCGQLEPLKIDQDKILISGHRRLSALIKLDIKIAKCIRKDYKNDVDRKMELIISNQQRIKSTKEKQHEIALLESYLDEWQALNPGIKINRAKQIALTLGVDERTVHRIKEKAKIKENTNEDISKNKNAEKNENKKKKKVKEIPHSEIMGNISYDFINKNFEKEGTLRKVFIEYLNKNSILAKNFILETPTLNEIYNLENISISPSVRIKSEMEFFKTFCLMYKGD
ncbi:MAG: ParB/RepB/Spo0J family partition protein [Mycoplasmatales bacterium]